MDEADIATGVFPAGEAIADVVMKSLQQASAMVVLLSEESVHSRWVQFEIGAAFAMDKPVVPILIGQVAERPEWLLGISYIDARGKSMREVFSLVERALGPSYEQINHEQEVKKEGATMTEFNWIRITDPDGEQKELFRASKTVYQQLFQPQHRESWGHFRKYILDAEDSRRQGKMDRPLDGYYVGCIGSEARGMALVTGYENHRLGFISYFGVLGSNTEEGGTLARSGFRQIKTELWTSGIDAVLIEVEKIPLSYLEKRDNPDQRDEWTELRLSFLRSIQRSGARKISFLDYLQPILDVDQFGKTEEASDLHLMVFHTHPDSKEEDEPNSLSRASAERYINFVYNVFYRDGFDVTDESDVRKATKYLHGLSQRVLEGLPGDLERVPLGEVSLRPFGKRALISYKIPEGEQDMHLLNRYLTDMGIHVTKWERLTPPGIGKPVKRTVFDLVQSSDVVIALLTSQFLQLKPMQEELADASKMGKRVIALVDADIDESLKKSSIGRLSKLLGETVVYLEFQRRRFDLAMYAVERTLRE
jgi:hypothetical protein